MRRSPITPARCSSVGAAGYRCQRPAGHPREHLARFGGGLSRAAVRLVAWSDWPSVDVDELADLDPLEARAVDGDR